MTLLFPHQPLQDACIDLLIGCGRLPEAAFFARTYAPSRMTEVVKLWQGDLAKINPKAAESLANPDVSPVAQFSILCFSSNCAVLPAACSPGHELAAAAVHVLARAWLGLICCGWRGVAPQPFLAIAAAGSPFLPC